MSETFDSKAGETNTSGPVAGSSATTSESQNNASTATGQLAKPTTVRQMPARISPRAIAAPWTVLASWYVVGLAILAYLKSRDDWGFEIIPWIMALLMGSFAWLAWLVAWGILSQDSLVARAAYALTGVFGLLAIVAWSLDWPDGFAVATIVWLRIAISVGVLFVLVRRHGWRLVTAADEDRERPSTRVYERWQFSISDMQLLVTGQSVFLGLLLVEHEFSLLMQAVVECSFVVCATFTLLVGLSWRNGIAAAAIAIAFTTMIWAIAAMATTPEELRRPPIYWLALLINGPALAGLLFSISIVRLAGYRLRT
jgi:hypothetical protein